MRLVFMDGPLEGQQHEDRTTDKFRLGHYIMVPDCSSGVIEYLKHMIIEHTSSTAYLEFVCIEGRRLEEEA